MTAVPPDKKDSSGSVASAMHWMGCLTLLLFWLPVIGQFIAVLGGLGSGLGGRGRPD